MLLPERCLEGCQRDSPPALPGPGVGSYVGTTVVRPQRPSSGQWVTNEPGVDEEAVTRQVWVLPCSDVSSGVVVQRSQQWSFRQTWARVPSLWYPATSLGGPVQRPAEGAMPPPCRGLCLVTPPLRAHRDSGCACQSLPSARGRAVWRLLWCRCVAAACRNARAESVVTRRAAEPAT